MISRTAFWSDHAETIRRCPHGADARKPPSSSSGDASMMSKVPSPKALRPFASPSLDRCRASDRRRDSAQSLRTWSGRSRLQDLGFELKAMGAVIDPNAARVNELPSRNRRRMSNYRDEVAFASGFHLEDGEPGLGVVECDALDRVRERASDGAAFRLQPRA